MRPAQTDLAGVATAVGRWLGSGRRGDWIRGAGAQAGEAAEIAGELPGRAAQAAGRGAGHAAVGIANLLGDSGTEKVGELLGKGATEIAAIAGGAGESRAGCLFSNIGRIPGVSFLGKAIKGIAETGARGVGSKLGRIASFIGHGIKSIFGKVRGA